LCPYSSGTTRLLLGKSMNVESESVTPAEPVEAKQVQQVEATSPDATTEQTQEPTETLEDKGKKEPWFQKRIGELTRAKYEGLREAEQARAEARELREQLARVQQGEQTTGVPVTAVQEAARQMLAEQKFNESCNKVYEAGVSEFPNFQAALANLQLVGVNREFLELTASSDAGAKLIHHLGTDLDEAARIVSLPPLQMARELTKLELKLGQTKAKPVSNAPAPITPIAGVKASSKDPSEMTDAEFAKWRRSQIAQR
jgi:hypothetical protein